MYISIYQWKRKSGGGWGGGYKAEIDKERNRVMLGFGWLRVWLA